MAPRRPPLTTKPLSLAVQYLMDDILLNAYATHAAILNAYGASHLGCVMSQILARLDLVDLVDDQQVAHVNECQAIACRNLALYEWSVRGRFQRAMDLLISFGKCVSAYNSPLRAIIEQARAEIAFERHLYAADWTQAERCINLVRCTSRTASFMMLAELRRRQGEPVAALECLDTILGPSPGVSSRGDGAHRSGPSFVGASASGSAHGFFNQSAASSGSSSVNPLSLGLGTRYV
jgi:hypothetical protein